MTALALPRCAARLHVSNRWDGMLIIDHANLSRLDLKLLGHFFTVNTEFVDLIALSITEAALGFLRTRRP